MFVKNIALVFLALAGASTTFAGNTRSLRVSNLFQDEDKHSISRSTSQQNFFLDSQTRLLTGKDCDCACPYGYQLKSHLECCNGIVDCKKNGKKNSDKSKKDSAKKKASVSELESVTVKDGQEDLEIQLFRLDLNGVTIELASLGASVLRFLVPSSSSDEQEDIVLGFESVKEMWESNNEVYFAATPGRVTNRIKKGQFQTTKDGQVYQLEINNEPNHLHRGFKGFSRRV